MIAKARLAAPWVGHTEQSGSGNGPSQLIRHNPASHGGTHARCREWMAGLRPRASRVMEPEEGEPEPISSLIGAAPVRSGCTEPIGLTTVTASPPAGRVGARPAAG